MTLCRNVIRTVTIDVIDDERDLLPLCTEARRGALHRGRLAVDAVARKIRRRAQREPHAGARFRLRRDVPEPCRYRPSDWE